VLSGPDYHPSAAWAPLSLTRGAGPVYVAALGQNADDDFSSVKAYGGSGAGRWGDYTAAVSNPGGHVWMGVEYISGVERTPYANWATPVPGHTLKARREHFTGHVSAISHGRSCPLSPHRLRAEVFAVTAATRS